MKDAISMNDETKMQNLIAQYLNGECSEAEIAGLLGWTNSSTTNKNEFLQIKDTWDLANHMADKSAQQLIFFYRNQLEQSKKSRDRLITGLSTIAAVLFIGLVISILVPRNSGTSTQYLNVYSVPLGSRSKILLFDGTEVHLNSGSTLTYPNEFVGDVRRITLSGEGFFKVKSDKKHPFIVKTADFEIEATGTRFNVCTYDNDPFSTTTLAEGAVSVRIKNSNQIFNIQPGEKFRLNRVENTYNQSKTDVESELAWKDGEFIFKSIPFPELVQRLERWYDVKLLWSGKKLESFSYTGRFKNQETVWQVLDALKLTTPISYQKTTFREFKINYKSKI